MEFPKDIVLEDRYHLVDVLGVGGQAFVFRAYDRTLDVERAIKVLSPKR